MKIEKTLTVVSVHLFETNAHVSLQFKDKATTRFSYVCSLEEGREWALLMATNKKLTLKVEEEAVVEEDYTKTLTAIS